MMKTTGKTASALLVLLTCLAACDRQASPPAAPPAPAPAAPAAAPAPTAYPPVEPPAPGTPGGLPDDRTPLSEAPFSPQSAQGAANVLQTYFALVESRRYAQAWDLWGQGGAASGARTADDFAKTFDRYSELHAQIGAPGREEGAAGSVNVTVPVVLYGRLTSGAEVHEKGEAVLRRSNDVPGSTPEQRTWRIDRIVTRPTG